MDIGSAFTFAFDDENWIMKLIIGGALVLGATLLSGFLVGLVLWIPLAGYTLQILQNVRDGRPTPLPEWSDFGSYFSKGLMVFVIYIIYLIIPILVFSCVAGVQAFIPQDSDAAAAFGIVVACLACLGLLIMLAVAILLPGALIFYAENEQFGDAFKFGEIFSFLSANLGDYIIVVLLTIVAQFIAQFGVILCVIGVFVTTFWGLLVQANLYGQLAQKRTGAVDVNFASTGAR